MGAMEWVSNYVHSFYILSFFFSIYLLFSFYMPGFLTGIEMDAVNWANKMETSMSKGTGVGESVEVGTEVAGLVGVRDPC